MSENTLPALSVADIINALDGVVNSSVDKTGSTRPLLECITSGVLRGACVMLGVNAPDYMDEETYAGIIKKLIANDIVVLALGYAEQAALNASLVDVKAKDLAGSGLKRVCELAKIPPVLPLGGLENVGNVVTIAGALCADSGLTVPQLPVVGADAAATGAQDVELGNTFAGLGVDTYIGTAPFEGTAEAFAESLGLKNSETAIQTVCADPEKLGDLIVEGIEKKRAALGI